MNVKSKVLHLTRTPVAPITWDDEEQWIISLGCLGARNKNVASDVLRPARYAERCWPGRCIPAAGSAASAFELGGGQSEVQTYNSVFYPAQRGFSMGYTCTIAYVDAW